MFYKVNENEKITRPAGVHNRIPKQMYVEEQKEIEKNKMPLHSQWTTNNITFCYEEEYAPKNLEKKQHQKEKEVYTNG